MEIEFRDYSIGAGRMNGWLSGWRTHILPMREHAGFRVSGAWVDPEHDRFIWVLSYEGPGPFDAAEVRYHEAPERLAVSPEPSDLIEHARIIRVVSVL